MNQLKNSRYNKNLRATAVAVAFFTGVASVTAVVEHYDSMANFRDEYLGDNDCLNGTAFDPANGAKVFVEDREVIVVPHAANFIDPSVLILSIDKHLLASPSFFPSDVSTAGYLADANCPGANGG